MKILLHICCAPCLIFPLEVLKLKGFDISGYFYNPNIHPFKEYALRKEALSVLNPGIEITYPPYLPQDFFRSINLKEDGQARCPICWKQRMKKTAHFAKENGFRYFTTTLLVSPYQNHELLKQIGQTVAKEEVVEFYYADFRSGFEKAQAEARSRNIYSQKYCGCIYSEIERYNNPVRK